MKSTSHLLAAGALAAALLGAYTNAHAEVDLTRNCGKKPLGDKCWSAETPAPTPAHPRRRVGNTTIYITGKTADGKFNVYNITGEIDEPNWNVGGKLYSGNDMIRYLDGVPAAMDGKGGIRCETICKNGLGQVIGVPEGYKNLAAGAKKK
jgi:hypothetical protein